MYILDVDFQNNLGLGKHHVKGVVLRAHWHIYNRQNSDGILTVNMTNTRSPLPSQCHPIYQYERIRAVISLKQWRALRYNLH